MTKYAASLELFHPLVRRWFTERLGEPTEVQRLAWPRIAAGEHVLVTAPTGSGKTLAAFLWAIDRLATGVWPGGRVRVLYVSPLKALANDVRRNLLVPLAGIGEAFATAGAAMPEIRVATRSGDTPAEERARMARRPPEVLITTPESLNILLASGRGRAMLSGVACVILDEIHAVIGNKRGVHLITAVERLARLAGEFQRLALSATVRPLERVARWIGGFELLSDAAEPTYRRRPVSVVESRSPKRYELAVRFPGALRDPTAPDSPWRAVTAEIKGRLAGNRSTLVFANSRRLVEKLTRFVNEDEAEELAWSHHGSLSRELRAVVEERLKNGELKAIVATNSLELGIDIGALDEVVLVQSPPSLASAAQRIGRAGHAVGETSRALFVPLVPRDLLDAAVVARAVLDGEIEPVSPVAGALDVLAQVIVSMTASEGWPVEELFAALRCADPYHELSRRAFDLVLDMLAGRYASSSVRGLRSLVFLDRIAGTVRARPGAERVVYVSGGTIPDRGLFHLRRSDGGAPLGELDEEFVWERSVGDTFTLGVQTWRIEAITHNDVLVAPVRARAAMAPFWRAEERDRGAELSERIAGFLEAAEPRLAEPAFRRELTERYRLDAAAADELLRFLGRQRRATGALPHRHRLVVERTPEPSGRGAGERLILHTFWGGRVNRPFALALQAAWRRRRGGHPEVIHEDDCVVANVPPGLRTDELLDLVTPDNFEELLREGLAGSGFFGARFREAAGCALLLPREGFRRRTPLWLSRQRAKELLAAVGRCDDFPLILETWRACLQDAFDLSALRARLDELHDGTIDVREVRTEHPSPFAAHVAWKRTNELMYEDDTPFAGSSGAVRADLLREVALTAHLRPRIPREVIATFEAKLRRTFPGYAPRTDEELLAFLIERVLIPAAQWRELLAAIERDGVEAGPLIQAISGKAAALRLPGQAEPAFVAAVESLPRVLGVLALAPDEVELSALQLDGVAADEARAALAHPLERGEPAGESNGESDPLVELVAELLRFSGPVEPRSLLDSLNLDESRPQELLDELADASRIVVGELPADTAGSQICDTDNFERLLRLSRRAARPAFEPLAAGAWPLFAATWQGVGGGATGVEGLRAALERLLGLAAPAEAWETELLPARLAGYQPVWLDALLAEGELSWFGCGEERLAFTLAGDRELLVGDGAQAEDGSDLDAVLPPGPGRFAFEELVAHAGLPSAGLAKRLWGLVWRGVVTNDGFAALRRGIETRFRPIEPERRPVPRPGRRLRFGRWRGSRPFAGHWFRLAPVGPVADPLEEEERNRERVRLLLDRYGVLFHGLLEHELPPLRWGGLFRALRLLELSGEVVAGQFFTGIAGLQFASPEALRVLRDGLGEERVFWINAADPVSPCGLGLEGLDAAWPRRLPTTHLAFLGARPAVVSERRGKVLTVSVPPDEPRLPDALGFLSELLTRGVRPLKAITVETINGAPAASSPYRAVLTSPFHTVREGTALRLSRRY